LDYSVSGRLQTDVLWELVSTWTTGSATKKVAIADLNKYPAFVKDEDNLAKALGVYPWLLVLIIVAMIYTLALKKCKSRNLKLRRQYNSLNRKLYFNTLLRFALEIDLRLTHQAVSVIWFVGLASLQVSALHGVFAVACILFPAGVLWFLLKNRTKLAERNMVARFGTLYQGIKTEQTSTALYSFVFLARRAALVCMVVFLHERAFFKPMGFMFMQVLYLIWAGWAKPHDDRWYNFLERLNEVGLVAIGYTMFLQTDFMED
jgi:hypothetical protein